MYIKICKLIGQCGGCPFQYECGRRLDFLITMDKERWQEELEGRIKNLQELLDKVNQM